MANFCSKCGAKPDEKAVICKNCGARIPQKKKKLPYIIISFVICFIVVFLFVAFFLYLSKRGTHPRKNTELQIEVGDIIEFGSYEQDNDISNGKEPMEWIVLENEDDHALLISLNCLDYKSYNTNNVEIIWETSSLREWLNNDFVKEAFSYEERKRILTQAIENPGLYMGVDENGCWIVTNSGEYVEDILYQTEDSNATEDKVYLLSADEVILYLGSGIIEYPPLTEYAKERFMESTLRQAKENGYNDEEVIRKRYVELEAEHGEGCCNWWLRSPGISGDSAAVVSYEADEIQIQNVTEGAAVRPVLWIETN